VSNNIEFCGQSIEQLHDKKSKLNSELKRITIWHQNFKADISEFQADTQEFNQERSIKYNDLELQTR
jgi:septal ring factor EnvC (AmiA/AmiB activator)